MTQLCSNKGCHREATGGFKQCERCRERAMGYLRDLRSRDPEKYRARIRRGRARHAITVKRWQALNAERVHAYRAPYMRQYKARSEWRFRASKEVSRAIKRGELVRPDSCPACGKEGKVYAVLVEGQPVRETQFRCMACHHKAIGLTK